MKAATLPANKAHRKGVASLQSKTRIMEANQISGEILSGMPAEHFKKLLKRYCGYTSTSNIIRG
jgi:hypothetical protein